MSAILVNGINSGAIAQGDGAVAVATEKGNIDMERGATIAQERRGTMNCHNCKKTQSPDQFYTVRIHINETPVFERTVCQSCLPLIIEEYKHKCHSSTERGEKPCLR